MKYTITFELPSDSQVPDGSDLLDYVTEWAVELGSEVYDHHAGEYRTLTLKEIEAIEQSCCVGVDAT